MSHWLALVVCIAANILANISVKRAMDATPLEATWTGLRSALLQPWLWLGVALAGIVFASYLYAIRGVPLSTAYPFTTSSATIGIALVGSLLFGEMLGWRGVLGIALVLAGLIVLASR
jgi:multidrug transporter EmrE-like cation transporter